MEPREKSNITKHSHSSMETYRRCRQKFYWTYVKNYKPDPSMGMIKGSIGHSALAVWYRTYDSDQALQAASDKLFEYERSSNMELSELWDETEPILSRYMDWSRKHDDFGKVHEGMIEKKFEIKIGTYDVIGYIDAIVEMSNGLQWILEHKFWSRVERNHLDLDPQVSLYLMAARKEGYQPQGVLYNIIKMSTSEASSHQPVIRIPLFRNAEGSRYIERELELQLNEQSKFLEGYGAVYRTPMKSCPYDCGFFSACLDLNTEGTPMRSLDNIPKFKEESEEAEDE